MASEYVSIGELVRITGCRYSTLKFYTEEGMLPFEQEEENLTRRFPREQATARIWQIKDLRNQGLGIPVIKEILEKEDRKEEEKEKKMWKNSCSYDIL